MEQNWITLSKTSFHLSYIMYTLAIKSLDGTETIHDTLVKIHFEIGNKSRPTPGGKNNPKREFIMGNER